MNVIQNIFIIYVILLVSSCNNNQEVAIADNQTNNIVCSTEKEVYVRGTSMLGIFNSEDKLILQQGYYNCHPVQKGDVVVFEYNNKKDFIKQVYGMPKDKITYDDNYLLINNKKIKNYKGEFYQVDEVGKSYIRLMQQTVMKNSIIPLGYYLILGTAKIGGYDFRRIGLVPYKNLIGKIKL